MTYAEQLINIHNSLTEESWLQGAFFCKSGDTLCMCAHGAAQAITNPQVQKVLETNSDVASQLSALTAHKIENVVKLASFAADSASLAVFACAYKKNNFDLYKVWKTRPDWVKMNQVWENKNYGNISIHWLMGMFGITPQFNDSSSTTLKMIKDKILDAVKWAERNETFLRCS